MTFTRILRTEVVQRTDLRIPYGFPTDSYGFLRIAYRMLKNSHKDLLEPFCPKWLRIPTDSLRISYGLKEASTSDFGVGGWSDPACAQAWLGPRALAW